MFFLGNFMKFLRKANELIPESATDSTFYKNHWTFFFFLCLCFTYSISIKNVYIYFKSSVFFNHYGNQTSMKEH